MLIYRICKQKYANDLSGEGARLTGGRWNSKGHAVIYTSSSPSLCALEMLVHLPLSLVPSDIVLVGYQIPAGIKTTEVEPKNLKKGWNNYPHLRFTQEIGDQWLLKKSTPLLKVPSAIVGPTTDFNYLINPKHPQFAKITINSIAPFSMDHRLFRKT